MNKINLYILLALLPFVSVKAQNTENEIIYFQCDFTEGIGTDFKTYDRDMQTLHFSMVQVGFEQGDAFRALREERVEKPNMYAASTSKYKYAKGETHQPSDDWMITPRIWIRGENARLSWRSKSICEQKKNKSGYLVKISTTGNTPEDFVDEPVFSIAEESSEQWVNHEISLSQYIGKRIYVAFINNNLDKEILGIDDLKVEGGKGACELTVDTQPYEFGKSEISIDCSVTSYSSKPVTDIKAYCFVNGQTYTKTINNISLANQEKYSFSFDKTIPAAWGDTIHYNIWAEINGILQDTIQCQTISFLYQPKRKTVVEEGTGMWCGYCPKGIVAMNLLAEKYPDEYIGIAIHYDDPMETRPYRIAMNFPSFPSGRFNRKYLCEDPMILIEEQGTQKYTTLEGGFETYFLKAHQQTLADISLQVEVIDNKVIAKTNTRFAVGRSKADYQIAFVVVEDNVTGPGYYQANYFAGLNTPIGGYENMDKKILNPTFNHVARGILKDYQGIPGSVPQEIEVGTTYSFEYNIEMPSTVNNIGNTKIVALLIDLSSGEIVNADITGGYASSIDDRIINPSTFICYKSLDNCVVRFNTKTTEPIDVRIFNSQGVELVHKTFETGIEFAKIPLQGQKGIVFISVEKGKDIQTQKLISD